MHHPRRVLLAVLAAALCFAGPAAAHDHAEHRDVAVKPVRHVAGVSGGEVLREFFVKLFNTSPTQLDPCVGLAGGRALIAAYPDVTCTVKVGTRVLLGFIANCSSVEAPPFFGATAEEQKACAIAANKAGGEEAVNIIVDGGSPVPILKRRFKVVSPQGQLTLPADNIFGAPPGDATFVAAGWVAQVRGLRPGLHSLVLQIVGGPDPAELSFPVNVVARGSHHDDD
jgi:hypothetical protein